MRAVNRKRYRQQRASAQMGIDLESPAQMRHALLHAEQPEASLRFRLESAPIVLDHDMYSFRAVSYRDPDHTGAGMTGAVVQRFLNNAVDARLVLFRKVIGDLFRGHVDSYAGTPGQFPPLPFESRDQAQVVEHGRA